MPTTSFSRLFLLASLAAGCFVSAQASDSASALQELSQADRAFHSRTCGLVLLSAGRAQARAVKAQGTNAFEQPMQQLTKAFVLLRDGRALQGGPQAARDYFNERLSTGRTTKPLFQALPEAAVHCEQWFETRRVQKDFDISEEARWDSVRQAELTLRTE